MYVGKILELTDIINLTVLTYLQTILPKHYKPNSPNRYLQTILPKHK